MFARGLLGVLLLGLVAFVGGLIGYQVGLTSTAAAAGTTVVVTGGFPGFGFLFFLLFVGFFFFAIAGRHRGGWGHRYGRGPWAGPMGPGGPGDASDPRRQWVRDMHRSLHEEDAAATPPTPAPPAG